MTTETPRRVLNLRYIGFDLRRNLRMFTNLFFVIVLPVAMFIIFGTMSDFSSTTLESGRGNITASIMVSMGAYAAITATTSLAGSAAVELQQGWGRQLGLTPFSNAGYITSKVIVALSYAVLAITAVYIAGVIVGAKMDGWVWAATAGLLLVGAMVFALYGLAFGLLLRSEAAVGAASGIVVILMFLGNAFVPLSGFLLQLSVFTPVWGVVRLSAYPLDQGVYFDGNDGSPVHYELWQMVCNLAVWGAIFAALCLIGVRRGTSRR